MAALRPGDVFAGSFRVVRPLAEGGMGSVFVAEQLSTGKLRALKLLRSEFTRDFRTRERFEQEARVASRIESEHVVEVVSAGIEAETDTPWIAMELLEGQDLAAYLRDKAPLSLVDARQILGQVGHALAAAHRAGVVHRDLKPENVFIATTHQRDRSLVVKVLDFGIAKIVAEARAAQHDTAALGTPRWMAPEQADSGGRVSAATDVWSFGLLAFLLLTNKLFWLTARGEGGVMGMMREVLFDPIPVASARAVELGATAMVSPAFDVWFARCVARPPEQRFPDAATAAAALDTVLAGASAPPRAQATPPPGTPSGAPWGVTPYPAEMPPPPLVPSWTGASAMTGPRPESGGAGWKIAVGVGGVVAVLGLLVVLGAWSLARFATGPSAKKPEATAPALDLSGSWTIASGTQPGGGGSYTGTVALAKSADAYRMTWAITRGAGYEGIAVAEGRTLGVSWSNMAGYMLCIYRVEGGQLRGKVYSSEGRLLGTEDLDGAAALSGTFPISHASGGYTGKVTIVPHGEAHTLTWTTSRGTWAGVGLRTQGGFVAGAMPGGYQAGVVAYEIVSPRRLTGRWAMMGDNRVGSETLNKR